MSVRRRTLFIGDVHGCLDEYNELLERFDPRPHDTIVHVGDLIARGPDSMGVIRRVRDVGALVVRGNHEERVLRWRASGGKTKMHPSHLQVAEALDASGWAWLESTPICLDFPEHDIRVIHAGVDPSITDIHQQSQETLLHIRTWGEPARPWAERYQGPPHIVFGHHAAAGLQLHRWATGLDTGCVYGGQLTGLVLGEGETVLPTAHRPQQLLHVKAKRVYVSPEGSRP